MRARKFLDRRSFLTLAGAGAATIASGVAFADDYPSRPIRFVVGFPPGGGADIVSRIMAAWLSERLRQQVFVENRPGASTNISIQNVLASPADGYTLLFVAASAAVNPSLFKNLPFDIRRDIAPVAGLIDFPLVLLANPSFPAKTVPELIAYAKQHPGKITIGSYGVGSTSHVANELFQMEAGVQLVHVPYKGGAPMDTDLMAGQVQLAIDVMTGVLPHIRAGAIRPIAMLSKTRFPGLPDVPSMSETLPLYVANSWCGIGVARGTPADVITRLNHEINAGLADPGIRKRLADVATTPIVFTPDQFGAYVASEVDKWAKVVRAAHITIKEG
ncbi:MAG TPA: tripartite tricarboxylate transporter substrate binding protein [Xanthobacteraceae bacterium]|jgi:tripartite-type tricarboxylate transporter receptor subunit TctC|nr:tripartite tricarboxylate transporter substrate binding protein [Xanthobacteraceae bacterium]